MAIQKEIKIFFRFLKDKGIFAEFFEEAKRNKNPFSTLNKHYGGDIKKLLENECSTTYIDKSLRWDSTIRGENFWSLKSREYADYYHYFTCGIKEDLLKDE